jgi:hypothetical protein
MAIKPKKEKAPATDTPAAHPAVREFVEGQLGAAQEVLRHGPAGQGWIHNETKRPGAEALLAYLQGLSDSLA